MQEVELSRSQNREAGLGHVGARVMHDCMDVEVIATQEAKAEELLPRGAGSDQANRLNNGMRSLKIKVIFGLRASF